MDSMGRQTHISAPCQPVRTKASRKRYKQTTVMHERHKIIFPCGKVGKMEETQLTSLVWRKERNEGIYYACSYGKSG